MELSSLVVSLSYNLSVIVTMLSQPLRLVSVVDIVPGAVKTCSFHV